MNLSIRKISFPLFFTAGLIFAGCGNKPTTDNSDNPVDTTSVKEVVKKPGEVQKYSQVPSPGEMFSFIKQLGSKAKDDISKLNSPDNLKKYNDNKSQSLNFGIYSADLLFCSTFNHGTEAMKYFLNVKKLGDAIGISTAINDKTADRINNNLSSPDSLANISNDLYFTTFDHLESNDRGNTLAMVMAGGWIESLYMVTSMEPAYKKDSPVVTRVGEQKYTLDNLLDFMKKYEKDADVASVLKQLGELKSEFDKIEDAKGPAAITVKKGKKILGGGSAGIVVSPERYKAIVEKTSAIRKMMTQN
ncbi:MAG: hypothetical protein ACHQRM_17955 [Bacteroidia bacterium]